MNSYRIVANSMQASVFLPEVATIIQMVTNWYIFLNIYNCVWKLAFSNSITRTYGVNWLLFAMQRVLMHGYTQSCDHTMYVFWCLKD